MEQTEEQTCMIANSRSHVLLALLAQGLDETARLQTASLLGDRSQYVGMSDIGRALDCQRAAVGQKLFAERYRSADEADPSRVLARQLRLQRGHWFEAGVARMFQNMHMPVMEQLEIRCHHQQVPLRAHLDFTFATSSGQPTVRILELKSCEQLPATLYSSYETQVYGQVGLLNALWDQPVFWLRDNGLDSCHGLTFPEICAQRLGVSMPKRADDVDIEAWVLCLTMSAARVYGPYCPHDAMLRMCMATAKRLWETLEDVRGGDADFSNLPTAIGFHPLCAWCDFNADCPKFPGCDHPQWEDALQQVAALKAQRTELDSQIGACEEALKTGYQLSNAQGRWISTGQHRFRVSTQAGRRTLSKEHLRVELTALLGLDGADELMKRCEVVGKSFDRLVIHPINSGD